MASMLVSYVKHLKVHKKQVFKSSTPSRVYDDKDELSRDRYRRPLDVDTLLWNEEIGGMLNDMLTMAGYPSHSTDLHTAFFRESVAPFLGFHPRGTTSPQTWKSFMTDDHTPAELSWCWSSSSDTPAVRYSVDPISRSASQGIDAVNTVANIQLLGETLSLAPNADLYLHRHFRDALISSSKTTESQSEVPQSQCFIAFDLLERDIVVKQYYIPHRRAIEEGTSNWELVKNAIKKLENSTSSLLTSFGLFVEFIESFPLDSRPEVEILAIDCLDPTQSRIKVYCRSLDTRLQSVMDFLALGGRAPKSRQKEDSLRELWLSVFGLDANSYKDDHPLPAKKHRTGGMLYYFEFKSNASVPKSKVYLPVRHYAKNDGQIARGLSGYLDQRGKRLSRGSYYESVKKLWFVVPLWHAIATGYSLTNPTLWSSKHRSLTDGLGFHTYVSWASDGNKWNVTAYFNPESYRCG